METPELDKQLAIIDSGEADTIQKFLDWLQAEGIVLHRWTTGLTAWAPCVGAFFEPECMGDDCARCGGTGGKEVPASDQYVAITESFETLMAKFFDIDLDKVEQERRAILENLTTN